MRCSPSQHGQIYLRPTRRARRRRPGLVVLLAGIALTAVTAAPPGQRKTARQDFPVASIPQGPAAELPPHRVTLAASRLTLSDLVFGAPAAIASSAVPLSGDLRLAGEPEQPAAEAPARVALAEPSPGPVQALTPEASTPESSTPEAAPLPPPNPFRQNAQRSVIGRIASRSPVQAAATPPQGEPGFFQRLFGSPAEPPSREPSTVMAYAPANDERVNPLREMSPFRRAVPPEKTAVYVIDQRIVYMPNGSRLEAHSGLGPKKDDPRYVHIRMKGATPPNVYNLVMRERLFHGVEAIRMLPTQRGKMFGRDGILAHSYMLGPGGDSNGCISFRDYAKFLTAFKRGEVTRIVVVADASSMMAMNMARAGR